MYNIVCCMFNLFIHHLLHLLEHHIHLYGGCHGQRSPRDKECKCRSYNSGVLSE